MNKCLIIIFFKENAFSGFFLMCQTWPKVLTQNTQLNTYIWLGYWDDYILEVHVKILFYFLFVITYSTHSLQKFTLLKIDCKK